MQSVYLLRSGAGLIRAIIHRCRWWPCAILFVSFPRCFISNSVTQCNKRHSTYYQVQYKCTLLKPDQVQFITSIITNDVASMGSSNTTHFVNNWLQPSWRVISAFLISPTEHRQPIRECDQWRHGHGVFVHICNANFIMAGSQSLESNAVV